MTRGYSNNFLVQMFDSGLEYSSHAKFTLLVLKIDMKKIYVSSHLMCWRENLFWTCLNVALDLCTICKRSVNIVLCTAGSCWQRP